MVIVDEGVNDTVDYVYKHGFCVAFGCHVCAFKLNKNYMTGLYRDAAALQRNTLPMDLFSYLDRLIF